MLDGVLPRLLEERKMTQDRLAELTGIERTDINAFANGRKPVGPARLERIARALEVSLVDLGAPEEQDETPARETIHDRLEELAATVRQVLVNQQTALEMLEDVRKVLRTLDEASPDRPKRKPGS